MAEVCIELVVRLFTVDTADVSDPAPGPAADGTPVVTKSQALAAYEGNASALARALGVTPQAVYQWPDGPIREGHALKLWFVLKPEFFQAAEPAATAPQNDAQEAA